MGLPGTEIKHTQSHLLNSQHSPACHGMRQRMGKVKVRKLRDSDTVYQAKKRGKSTYKSNHSPPLTSRQMASQPPSNSHFVRQFPTSLPLLTPALQLFLVSTPPVSRQGWGPCVQNQKEKALSLCKACSLVTKALVLYQQGFSHKCTAPYGLLRRMLTQPDPVQSVQCCLSVNTINV